MVNIINNQQFWPLLTVLLEIIKPISKAQLASESDKTHLSYTIPRWLNIRTAWNTLRTSQNSVLQSVDWDSLIKVMDDRFGKQMNNANWATWALNPLSLSMPLRVDQQRRVIDFIKTYTPVDQMDKVVAEFYAFKAGEGLFSEVLGLSQGIHKMKNY